MYIVYTAVAMWRAKNVGLHCIIHVSTYVVPTYIIFIELYYTV